MRKHFTRAAARKIFTLSSRSNRVQMSPLLVTSSQTPNWSIRPPAQTPNWSIRPPELLGPAGHSIGSGQSPAITWSSTARPPPPTTRGKEVCSPPSNSHLRRSAIPPPQGKASNDLSLDGLHQGNPFGGCRVCNSHHHYVTDLVSLNQQVAAWGSTQSNTWAYNEQRSS